MMWLRAASVRDVLAERGRKKREGILREYVENSNFQRKSDKEVIRRLEELMYIL